MKWSKLFRPATKKQSKQSDGIDSSLGDESRQDDAAAPKTKKLQPMMGSLAQHHVSTNHLCGIKVSQCCNRALYDAKK